MKWVFYVKPNSLLFILANTKNKKEKKDFLAVLKAKHIEVNRWLQINQYTLAYSLLLSEELQTWVEKFACYKPILTQGKIQFISCERNIHNSPFHNPAKLGFRIQNKIA